MIQISREILPESLAKDLSQAQDDLNPPSRLTTLEHWKRRRERQFMAKVLAILKRMAGPHEGCMYCCHSHATDIEHFWPKSRYPERCYCWTNFLLACSECGRLKSDRFPLQQGEPLLINPCDEDPWQHLDFDPTTGNITARYQPETDCFSPKGEMTVEILHFDRREALALVYRRTYLRLCDKIRDFLRAPDPVNLEEGLRAMDDHGLLPWLFSDLGSQEPPISNLKTEHPQTWNNLVERLTKT